MDLLLKIFFSLSASLLVIEFEMQTYLKKNMRCLSLDSYNHIFSPLSL